MSHAAEEWTDRFGRSHATCIECEEAWPCRESMAKPKGWLRSGRVMADRLVVEMAHGFDVSVDDIMGDSMRRHVCVARACAMAVVKQATDWSANTIGDYFGREHSTVKHAVDKVMNDPELKHAVDLVAREVQPSHSRLFALSDRPTANSQGYDTSDSQLQRSTL